MNERYAIEYLDSRGRWHRRRQTFDLASQAVDAARNLNQRCDVYGWRVMDAAKNEVDSSSMRRRLAAGFAVRVLRGEVAS